MKNNFKWHKELIDGKAILHQDFVSAEKLAIETYKKFEKFNKSFEG